MYMYTHTWKFSQDGGHSQNLKLPQNLILTLQIITKWWHFKTICKTLASRNPANSSFMRIYSLENFHV